MSSWEWHPINPVRGQKTEVGILWLMHTKRFGLFTALLSPLITGKAGCFFFVNLHNNHPLSGVSNLMWLGGKSAQKGVWKWAKRAKSHVVFCLLVFALPKTSENSGRKQRLLSQRVEIYYNVSFKCFSFGKYYLRYQRQSIRQKISMPFYFTSSHNLAIKSGRASLQLKIFCGKSFGLFLRESKFWAYKTIWNQEFYSTKAGKMGFRKLERKLKQKGTAI